MVLKSLLSRGSEWSDQQRQLEILNSSSPGLVPFEDKLRSVGAHPLKPAALEVFQVNLGYMCNQACNHCHVDAAPDRKEIMTRETMTVCLEKLKESGARTLDITGGAPEMNPEFRWFVTEAVKGGVKEVIVRCNLTIIVSNKKYHDLPGFFAANNVHVVSSLPFYRSDRTDRQRGDGVFNRSMEAIRMLNAVGYGMPDSPLRFDLVYNPAGAFLPAGQASLERDYKEHLLREHGIHFHHLIAITNMPVARFLEYLIASDNLSDYMDVLVNSFNPGTVQGLMCRNTLSVGWEGTLYDCDFNQMLGLRLATEKPHISALSVNDWNNRSVVVNQHCYGCTAGAGSSCQGATT